MSDRFEEALARVELPQPDPEWKNEILFLASSPRRRRRLPILKLAIAACWLTIGVLHLSMPEVDGDREIAVQHERAPASATQLSSLFLLASYTREIESYD
ncbi:MAG: hypothetical protein ACR2RV_27040 [Verrucomicrobiales bacterium]